MSNRKPTVESYLHKAEALARLFPSLKKYRRRKTLKGAEKAAIARAHAIFEITRLPNVQRPEKYQHYTFPANRKRSIKTYLSSAKELEYFDKTLRRFRGRKRLKPGEKGRIAYLEKRLRNIGPSMEAMTPAEMRKLRRISPHIGFPIKGIGALKMRHVPNHQTKDVIAYKREITSDGMKISLGYRNGEKRVFLFIHTGADIDRIRAAADYLTARDGDDAVDPDYLPFGVAARQLFIWTNHGRTADGQPTTPRLLAQLGDESALQDLAETSASLAADIVSGGFALVFGDPDGLASEAIKKERDRQNYRTAKSLRAAMEGTFILGVIGIFVRPAK